MFFRIKRKAVCILCLAALCLPLVCASCSSVEVSPACVGYAAGKEGELSFAHRENKELILPPLFVQAFALYAANADGNACKSVIYGGDVRYVKGLADSLSETPDGLVALMNETAQKNGLSCSFGSVCGQKDRETELRSLFGETTPDFKESRGTLSDMKKAAELFTENNALSLALSGSAAELADGSQKSRTDAPLVSENSQFRLKEALWYLAGNAVMDGRRIYAAVCAVEDGGARAYAAVLEDSGEDVPVNYAACDAGNLCGRTLGQNYGLAYSPSRDPDRAGMTVGSSIFTGAFLVILIAAGVMLAVAVTIGVISTVRRNRAGRIKYAPKKENAQEDPASEDNPASEDDPTSEER